MLKGMVFLKNENTLKLICEHTVFIEIGGIISHLKC